MYFLDIYSFIILTYKPFFYIIHCTYHSLAPTRNYYISILNITSSIYTMYEKAKRKNGDMQGDICMYFLYIVGVDIQYVDL
jgi:hypothetical protein